MNIRFVFSGVILFAGSAVWACPEKLGHIPPPEAIEACASLEEGASVSFASPRGDIIKATCLRVDEQLVAVPMHRKPGHKKHQAQRERD